MKYYILCRLRKKDFVKEYLTNFEENFSTHLNQAKKFKDKLERQQVAKKLIKKDKTFMYFFLDVEL